MGENGDRVGGSDVVDACTSPLPRSLSHATFLAFILTFTLTLVVLSRTAYRQPRAPLSALFLSIYIMRESPLALV